MSPAAVFHCHTLSEEVELEKLIEVIDKATKKRNKKPAFVKEGQSAVARLRLNQSSALETFAVMPQLGRFTLRDEGITIAIGKITAIVE